MYQQSCPKYIETLLSLLLLKMFDQAIHRPLMSHRPLPQFQSCWVATPTFFQDNDIDFRGRGALSHNFCTWLRVRLEVDDNISDMSIVEMWDYVKFYQNVYLRKVYLYACPYSFRSINKRRRNRRLVVLRDVNNTTPDSLTLSLHLADEEDQTQMQLNFLYLLIWNTVKIVAVK